MDSMHIGKAIAINYNARGYEITASLFIEAHMSLKSEGFAGFSAKLYYK
jgi:hypothetical protein